MVDVDSRPSDGSDAESVNDGPSAGARTMRSWRVWLAGEDRGSGTVSGVMLVAVTAILLTVIAAGGRVLICIAHARSVADQAAIAGAVSQWEGKGDPCVRAGLTARANDGNLVSCQVRGEDVVVKVSYATSVPVAPQVVRAARAGPVECGV
ncbi:flp pilus-assembly TadE/G-like family protein [Bifidobacterium sp. ESL0763]|uniref:Rv3654c family TadE-like protein n=1 Tax=Bifidobacterium sp. ESL0763 TaxID=2983227 RepID=UPI0023F8221C|nr:Rv3654c family TadE-like protein [Bifidobacterium sp. ESL0763]MDF7664323.1 flp pilus-assembly TadE/G-like family protein [Bifidobacterium sp. ESL0763]